METTETIIMGIFIFWAGYAIAEFRVGERLRKQQESLEYDRYKAMWCPTHAARRMGINIESRRWLDLVLEEEKQYEKDHSRN